MSTSRARPVLAAAAAAILLLTGCADEEVPVSMEDPQTDEQTQDTELAPDATSTAEVGGQEHTTRAITTAEGVVAGGRAVDLDCDDDNETFDVTVLADEVAHEVTVSIDGSRVVEQEEDGDVDEDDRERLTTATVTMAEALETAMSDRSGGVAEIDLDTRDGAVVWEVTVQSSGGEEEIVVDAASGEVL
ncbi:PepSY domain-containing protein [Georgenia sp. 10Sc9-8]|uniref:PepSY domain-containing protein n=1 Tax=Georgenia halotolerans TaxID=3028317 RepID=A0ABT5TWF0_9MICO|nr:PepSY domain-containing protein [Georgenia halotolerans]